MARFKLTIEYEGTRYSGWQIQKGGKSVQGEILDACRDLFEGAGLDVYGAGRTDSGVHAIGQVAHLDVETELPVIKIRYGINDRLPSDISVISVENAAPSFHARHDAVARSYIYQVSRRRTALGKKLVWWIKDELDVSLMNETASMFEGLKDFRSFTDLKLETGSTKAEVIHSRVYDHGDILLFHVIGSHFLWKQVRRMTGVLVEAGRGKLPRKDIAGFFRNHSDIPSKLTAPPSGLFLEKVYYKDDRIVYDARPVLNILKSTGNF
jgi:tRNA pseudouridine38-40 synthase